MAKRSLIEKLLVLLWCWGEVVGAAAVVGVVSRMGGARADWLGNGRRVAMGGRVVAGNVMLRGGCCWAEPEATVADGCGDGCGFFPCDDEKGVEGEVGWTIVDSRMAEDVSTEVLAISSQIKNTNVINFPKAKCKKFPAQTLTSSKSVNDLGSKDEQNLD